MFSQLRNAVEQLAQQPMRALDEDSSGSRSQSLDLQGARPGQPLSSSQLAESAISSLRKSFVSQRANSFSGGSSPASPSKPSSATDTAPPTPPPATRPKSKLEERLRQATKVALSEPSPVSSSPPARTSRVASPSPMGRNRTKKPEPSAVSTPPTASPSVTPAASEESKQLQQPDDSSKESNNVETAVLDDAQPEGAIKPSTPTSVSESTTKVTETGKPESEVVLESATSLPSEGESGGVTGADTQAVSISSPQMEEQQEAPEPSQTAEDESQASPGEEEKGGFHVEENAPTNSILPTVPDATEDKEEPKITDETTSPGVEEVTPNVEQENNPPPALAAEDLSQHEDSIDVPPDLTNNVPTPEEDAPALPVAKNSTEELATETIVASTEETTVPDVPPPDSSISEDNARSSEEGRPQPASSLINITPAAIDQRAEVESLQARLKQIEQRFSDVSTSFKRLQAEKLAADNILKEVSPLESISDTNALRDFFANLHMKDQVFQEEIKRLNQKLELQEDRLEEVRETHKLESNSRSDEVKKLKTQLDETEALFQAAQRATTHAEEAIDKQKEEFAKLSKEVDAARNTAKEEEEKRVKAISLLKTVRQKLVKAEKDKEDVTKELQVLKEREKGDKDKEQADRQSFQKEIDSLNSAHDKAIANMKNQFNKDFNSMQERYEQEITLIRGQFELEIASLKSTHSKELGTKGSQIATLENSLNNITRDKNAFFDQLQLRQAEVESAQAHLESLQHQNTELQFQLRESNDRLALLKEEYSELMREQESRSRDPVTSADEVARMISAVEAKYEAKLSEMRRNIAILEKERSEGEADWSKKLKEKVKDLEDLKRVLGTANRSREADENIVNELKAQLAAVQDANKSLEQQTSELPRLREQIRDLQRNLKEQEEEINVKVLMFEKQIEEHKGREMQLKQSNKTLREELRKVQSSAALLERQRNPGVGYWTTRVSENNGPAEPRASLDSPSRTSSPVPSSAASTKNTEEEVNLEYLRNVILQFLEHKEMRPNLVKVLSIILHFTPQETRRLIAKV